MEVSEIEPNINNKQSILKVCAYARVSTKSKEQLHSLKAQIDYCKNIINNNPLWIFTGIYVDFGISGTLDDRVNFNKMIVDCENSKIDLIIVKSVSRFARNTVTLLENVRKLRNIGVDIYFEKENIHTLEIDGEFLLTIISGIAQAESESVSENTKWRIHRNFDRGINRGHHLFGYDNVNGKLLINTDEAKIIKAIFQLYLMGFGISRIAKYIEKASKVKFSNSGIWYILRNESYCGNMILQKTYCDDYITKKRKINNGKLDKVFIEDCHEPIISKEMFAEVQKKIKIRREKYANNNNNSIED